MISASWDFYDGPNKNYFLSGDEAQKRSRRKSTHVFCFYYRLQCLINITRNTNPVLAINAKTVQSRSPNRADFRSIWQSFKVSRSEIRI